MKIQTLTLTLLSTLALTCTLPSCSSDDPVEELPVPDGTDTEEPAGDNDFWAQPHRVLLGLKGPVSSLTATMHTPDDGEDYEGLSTWTRFNAAGMVTYYNPTGVAENRMLGMEMESYTYSYDAQNRMVLAVASTLGEGQTVYTLAYEDDSDRCVPLPFTVGGLELCMAEGLSALSSDAEGFTCTLSDTEICYTQTTEAGRGTMQTVTTYTYADAGARFPSECTVRTLYEGEELGCDRTAYGFDAETGRLLSLTVERTEGGEPTETETRTYHPTLPLCLVQRRVDTPYGDSSLYDYSYDASGWLRGITLTDGETTAVESYAYSGTDSQGNWTRGDFMWNSRVDLNHWDGSVTLSRTLEY